MNPPTLQQEIQTARDAAAVMLAFTENDLPRVLEILRPHGLSENPQAALFLKGCASFIHALLQSVLIGTNDETVSMENVSEILRVVVLDMAEAG